MALKRSKILDCNTTNVALKTNDPSYLVVIGIKIP